MTEIKFPPKQKQDIVHSLQQYLEDEMDIELGQFDVEFLLDFISNTIGPEFYNQGVRDAQRVVESKMLDITDELYQIEKESDY